MGMGFPFGSARRAGARGPESSRRTKLAMPLPGDPDPARFEITSLERFGPFVVAEIVWPDAANFEGRKILIYRATVDQIRNAKRLDPHFQEERGPLAPVARFEPGLVGKQAANYCAGYLARRWP